MYDVHVPGSKSRKAVRPATQSAMHQAPDYVQQLQHPVYQQAHSPYYPVHNASYVFEASPESQTYMLPYTQFQHIPHPNSIRYHPVQGPPHTLSTHNPAAPFPQHMPPLKRPRTEIRNSGSVHHNGSSRHASTSAKSTPTKSRPNHKTFSDFRISRIKIGTFESLEEKEGLQARDSKVRFCFRNPSDRDPPSTSSATEAALMTPDRISISLCKGSRRIVVPAYHISAVDFRRSSGEITISTDGWAAFETSVVDNEELEHSAQAGSDGSPARPSTRWRLTEEDITKGQLSSAKKIEIKLDLNKPLTEPKWTRGNLEDHIDSSSRFLHIMHISDAVDASSFEYFVDRWAGQDAEKAYFCDYHLKPPQLLDLLTSLMSMSNVLTPAVTRLLSGLLAIIEKTKLSTKEVLELLRSSLLLIPPHMLTKALDSAYAAFESTEEIWGETQLQIGYSYGGAKRQRGESEVPSDQLAKTTLDEKRRRLSDSGHQLVEPGSGHQQSTAKRRSTKLNEPISIPMQSSKSEELTILPPRTPQPTKSRRRSEETSSNGSGARLSREELLRTLEDCEAQDLSSDHELDTEETPIEATTLKSTTFVEDWPPVVSETMSKG